EPSLKRPRGFHLAFVSEFVSLLPRNSIPLSHVFTSHPHMVIMVHLPEAIKNHCVEEPCVTEPYAPAFASDDMRSVTHALHPASHDKVAIARLNRLRCQHDRLQAGAAHLVDCHSPSSKAYPRAYRRLPCRVLAESGRYNITHYHLVD